MVERFRIYKGATELNYGSDTYIEKSNDTVVNSGHVMIEANANVTIGDVIDYKKSDGSTTMFTGQITRIGKDMLWDLNVITNGYELNNIWIIQVYDNRSPEYIVQDIIDTYTTNLTYSSSTSSGVTLTRYIANGYGIDIIKEMMDILDWQIRIDENDNVYFEPKGATDNGITFTNGSNIQITEWTDDNSNMFNRVKIKGGTMTYYTQDTGTGDAGGTKTFSLTYKPMGVMKVTLNGVEQEPTAQDSLYTVDAENKTVTFATAPPDGHAILFDYQYEVPVIVDMQNDDSIADYGEIYKEIRIPAIDNFVDGRQYATKLLDAHSNPYTICKGFCPNLNFDREVGEIVTVVDTIRSREELMVIVKIKYNAGSNRTEYEFGEHEFVFYDWQREVQERVKKLESMATSDSTVAYARIFKHNIGIALTHSHTWRYKSPQNTFIPLHPTLGMPRSDEDSETDCSGTGHHGTWMGTGVTAGSQFTTSGWRLSAGEFNGSDRKITVVHHADFNISTNFTISFAVKVANLPGAEKYLWQKWDGTDGFGFRINASDKVELIYSDSGSDSVFAVTTALTADTWQHLVFVKTGIGLEVFVNGVSDNTATEGATIGSNSNDIIIGNYSSDWLTGFLDEIRIYNTTMADARAIGIYNKTEGMTDCIMYLSFDNPVCGDQFSGFSDV